MKFPQIIQGGMGAGISDWKLARAVASRGQVGVVSGVALDRILTRRLELGDLGGHMRRALAAFPDQSISSRLIDRYFIDGGKPPDQPFKTEPMAGHNLSQHLEELLVVSNFVQIFLAKEGHDGMVGINYLQKIPAPLLPSFYGAMLAGVDIIIVGAGIPIEIPAALDSLFRCEPASIALYVKDVQAGSAHKLSFDPKDSFDKTRPSGRPPLFFPIASSVTLASLLMKKCKGGVDGLIIEEPSAGGHNAPPRGQLKLTPDGEPIYGPRDEINLAGIKALGLPFWMAGSYGTPEKFKLALDAGAAGIQVGTLFAFCDESRLEEGARLDTIKRCRDEVPRVFTDPVASPTGFPFKVISIPGTLSDPAVYANRRRRCDLGYLREAYEKADGTLGWRCPAQEPEIYVRKGGAVEDTVGRKCLCNALMSNIDLAQVRGDEGIELPLVTSGDNVSGILQVMRPDEASYAAADVLDYLLAGNET